MSERRRILNLNDRLMKAIKAVNSISGSSVTEEDLRRQRSAMELAGRLAAPTDEVRVKGFSIGDIACERVEPIMAHNPQHIILYAHGGGYTCGELGYARILAAKLAVATGFTVVSFAYRLAPEHSYPAQGEDGYAVWSALREENDPIRMLFAGDSAGGNLILCLTQRLIAERQPIPEALLLFSPWTDMTATAGSYETYKERDPILTREYITGVREAYLGAEAKDADTANPAYSPLYGDFKDFPPTLIQVGRNEILFDDSDSLAGRLRAAGSRAILDVEEEGWHVYQQMPLPMAHRAMQRLAGFVTETVYH